MIFCSVHQQHSRVAHLWGTCRRRDRIWSLPFLPRWVSVLLPTQLTIAKVLRRVEGKALMGSVYLSLIHISVCNHPPFPPLETYENYDINLGSSNHSLTSVPVNLVDQVWKDRPPILDNGIIYLPDRVIRGSPSAQTHTLFTCWALSIHR